MNDSDTLRMELEVEQSLHKEALQIAIEQRAKADRELWRADRLESQAIKAEEERDARTMELRIVTNAFERAMFALESLRDAALSSHDYNCHGDCCGTCCELVESVNRATDLIEEHKPTP